ncbi:hypothetical protein [Curtobacterium pusillum]|uniref:hypothetical protein n=1 Tax=Curtobacterium pusillum TaxID=69373 RepID=UPI00119D0F8A|nr:hypothetical protein [Curtobacterium pusillum]
MAASNNSAAKQVWDEINAEAEASQDVVGGTWLASDTAARACGSDGARWVVNRFGPGTSAADRDRLLDDLATRWEAKGWTADRSATTGDYPGVQLRYPGASTLETGFFVRFRTNENGSSLQIQTPCTPGDVDQLNREKYAEKHTNTPPDIPGVSDPSATATP